MTLGGQRSTAPTRTRSPSTVEIIHLRFPRDGPAGRTLPNEVDDVPAGVGDNNKSENENVDENENENEEGRGQGKERARERKKIKWDESAVDNETLNRKSSKSKISLAQWPMSERPRRLTTPSVRFM